MATGSRVTIADTATSIFEADIYGAGDFLVRNQDDTVSIFLGGSGVTDATGYELKAGESLSFDLFSGASLYGIVTTGTARLDVLQIREQ